MKVGIDTEIFSCQMRGGISKHFSLLIRYLKLEKDIEIKLNSIFHNNLNLKQEQIGIYISPRFRRLIRIFLVFIRLSGHKTDIIHYSYSFNNIKKSKIPSIITAYDMIPENGFSKNIIPTLIESKYKAFQLSDVILSISHFTKKEIIKFYPEFTNKIHVIHLGVDESWDRKNVKEFRNNNLNKFFKRRYITYVGNRHEYKNAKILFEVLNNISDIDLIFIGGEEPSILEKEKINNYKLNSRIHFLKANDYELKILMKNSYAICIPSRMEGFSIPLIEALYLDIPIIASNIPVHNEVAGGFAHLLEYKNPDQWSDFIKKNNLKNPSHFLGKKNYIKLKKYFSYKRVVKDHIRIYKKLIY